MPEKKKRKTKEGKRVVEGKEPEFDQQVVDVSRVMRVTAGGKKLRFRACVVVGDRNGRVGSGIAKGNDVAIAVEKAVRQAKKQIIAVPIVKETIPHEIREKYKAARILLKPASKGKGIIAGGPMRVVLELAGVKNATGKILGSRNKINNVRCTINALKKLKK